MELKIEILIKRIELLRENLYLLLKCRDLTDYVVVDCSQSLDKLLLEYEKHKYGKDAA